MKFEQRWAKGIWDIDIKGWVMDTMLYAHIQNNQSKTTGLKFQSFVKFGIGTYDKGSKKYFKADDPNAVNNIKNAPINNLLRYNGYDSKLSYELGVVMLKELSRY